jgi:hypothetical protein
MPYAAIVLTMFALLADISAARAVVLCAKRNGTLKIRDACRAHEMRLDPAALGLQGTRGASR